MDINDFESPVPMNEPASQVDAREQEFINLLESTGHELNGIQPYTAAQETPMVERLRLCEAQLRQYDYVIRHLYRIIRLDYELRE